MTPVERFRAWLGLMGWTKSKAAEELHCQQSTISRLCRGDVVAPDAALQEEIERATRSSPLGQITVRDWHEAALARARADRLARTAPTDAAASPDPASSEPTP